MAKGYTGPLPVTLFGKPREVQRQCLVKCTPDLLEHCDAYASNIAKELYHRKELTHEEYKRISWESRFSFKEGLKFLLEIITKRLPEVFDAFLEIVKKYNYAVYQKMVAELQNAYDSQSEPSSRKCRQRVLSLPRLQIPSYTIRIPGITREDNNQPTVYLPSPPAYPKSEDEDVFQRAPFVKITKKKASNGKVSRQLERKEERDTSPERRTCDLEWQVRIMSEEMNNLENKLKEAERNSRENEKEITNLQLILEKNGEEMKLVHQQLKHSNEISAGFQRQVDKIIKELQKVKMRTDRLEQEMDQPLHDTFRPFPTSERETQRPRRVHGIRQIRAWAAWQTTAVEAFTDRPTRECSLTLSNPSESSSSDEGFESRPSTGNFLGPGSVSQ